MCRLLVFSLLLFASACTSVWVEKMPLPDGRDWYAYYGQVGQPLRGYMVTSDRFVYDPKTNKLERLQSDVWTSSGFGASTLKSLPVTPTLPVY
jgi:hypothetical protein